MDDVVKNDEVPLYERIYRVVRQIPHGQVATYGQVARLTGGCTARMVGYALAGLHNVSAPDVPWQRVINRQGRISILDPIGGYVQRKLLEEEGVQFDERDRVNLNLYGWLGEP
jgi:methylated-DNA-protein-cysteine methyltransferase-like protein